MSILMLTSNTTKRLMENSTTTSLPQILMVLETSAARRLEKRVTLRLLKQLALDAKKLIPMSTSLMTLQFAPEDLTE